MLRSTNTNVFYISDEDLRKTYYPVEEWLKHYKTNLLGLEEGCDIRYRVVPVTGRIYDPESPVVNDIIQSDLNNCAFLSILRTIVRRYPEVIKRIIKEVDDTHVQIQLFDNENENHPPINYILDKTIVRPVDSSLLNSIYHFFPFYDQAKEKSWVKLIEKALALHCMRHRHYETNLMNIQNHGHNFLSDSNGITPSYDDVIQVFGTAGGIFTALLGCDTKREIYFGSYKSRAIIQDEFVKGELIVVDFRSNNLGLETNHSYELVNFAQFEKEEYVILANPWGYNKNNVTVNQEQLSSLKLLVECKLNSKDRSLIILPKKQFEELVGCCMITSGITAALQNGLNEMPVVKDQIDQSARKTN